MFIWAAVFAFIFQSSQLLEIPWNWLSYVDLLAHVRMVSSYDNDKGIKEAKPDFLGKIWLSAIFEKRVQIDRDGF